LQKHYQKEKQEGITYQHPFLRRSPQNLNQLLIVPMAFSAYFFATFFA
jgi:hypothetical protein